MDLGVRREIKKVMTWPMIGALHDRDPTATIRAAHRHLLWDLTHDLLPYASFRRSSHRHLTRGDGGRTCYLARGHGLESSSAGTVWVLHGASPAGRLRPVALSSLVGLASCDRAHANDAPAHPLSAAARGGGGDPGGYFHRRQASLRVRSCRHRDRAPWPVDA